MHWSGIAFLILWGWASLVGAESESASTRGLHVVKKGETLSQIAQRHKVTIRQLKQWNNLKGDRIQIGQRLVLGTGKKAAVPTDPLASKFATWKDSVIERSRRERTYGLVVNKVQRRMDVYLSGKQVTSFPVSIGYADAREMTDRREANDHHLKEGVFHLSEVAWDNHIPKWDRIWMRLHTVEWAKKDYVSVFGEAGRKRLASWEAKHGTIQTDLDVKAFNAQNRNWPIWRGLGIHGGGTKGDWTLGCIALDRKNIRWLYDRLKRMPNGGVGTPIAVVRF